MDKLTSYFEELNAEFIKEVSSVKNTEVPEAMRDFYESFKSAIMPYGIIYDLELALNNSKRAPFFPDWFVFGQDNYSCFWLCWKGESDDGCYFTYWDHESGRGIEEPVWEDLLSFLKEVEEDAENNMYHEDDEE